MIRKHLFITDHLQKHHHYKLRLLRSHLSINKKAMNNSSKKGQTTLKFDTSYSKIKCFIQNQVSLTINRKQSKICRSSAGAKVQCINKKEFKQKEFLSSVICKLFNDDDQHQITQFIAKMTYSSAYLPNRNQAINSCPEQQQQRIRHIFSHHHATPSHNANQWSNSKIQQLYQVNTSSSNRVHTLTLEKAEYSSTYQQTLSDYSISTEQFTDQEAYIYYQNYNLYRQLQYKSRWYVAQRSSEFTIIPNQIQNDPRTTLMIRHIPNKYSEKMLFHQISKKFRNKINFLYLPIDSKNECNMGYAFVNFIDTKFIRSFYNEFNGRRWSKFNSDKICELAYARIQGANSLINHFENSLTNMNRHRGKTEPYDRQYSKRQVWTLA